jgi:hypothetical protein
VTSEVATLSFFQLRSNGKVHRVRSARTLAGPGSRLGLLFWCAGLGTSDGGVFLRSRQPSDERCAPCETKHARSLDDRRGQGRRRTLGVEPHWMDEPVPPLPGRPAGGTADPTQREEHR